jgi:hypothetical protein
MEQTEQWRAFFGHRTRPDGGCLVFVGSRSEDGYGFVGHAGRVRKTHRVSYELQTGKEIPEGLCVCHTCDNPPCVNPAHLWLGTVADNNRDRHAKGRTRAVPHHGSENGSSKLIESDIPRILADQRSSAEVARAFGVTVATVNLIRAGRIWQHVPGPRPGARKKVSPEAVAAIRADPRSQSAIARAYGISQPYVSLIKSGAHSAATK